MTLPLLVAVSLLLHGHGSPCHEVPEEHFMCWCCSLRHPEKWVVRPRRNYFLHAMCFRTWQSMPWLHGWAVVAPRYFHITTTAPTVDRGKTRSRRSLVSAWECVCLVFIGHSWFLSVCTRASALSILLPASSVGSTARRWQRRSGAAAPGRPQGE